MVVFSLAVGQGSDKSQQTDRASRRKGRQSARPNNRKVETANQGEMNRRQTDRHLVVWQSDRAASQSKQTRARRRKGRQTARPNNPRIETDSQGEMNRRKTDRHLVVCSLAVGQDSYKSQQTDRARRRKGRYSGQPNSRNDGTDSQGEKNR